MVAINNVVMRRNKQSGRRKMERHDGRIEAMNPAAAL